MTASEFCHAWLRPRREGGGRRSGGRRTGGWLAHWRRLLAAGLAVLTVCAPLQGAKLGEQARQKRAAQTKRAGLQQQLRHLKRDIEQTQTLRQRAAESLATSERAVSQAEQALRELTAQQRQAHAKLTELTGQQTKLSQRVQTQQKQLAGLLREQYMSGDEDRIRLLLSGDDPNRINRELRYLGYVSQAQGSLIESLRADMQKVSASQASVRQAQDELNQIEQKTRTQKATLDQEQARHAMLVGQLSAKLAAQRKQADDIVRNEQRLGALVNRLAQAIDQQQKAQALRRQQQAARAARLAAKNADRQAARRNPDAIDNDVPPKSAQGNELGEQPSVQTGVIGRSFAAMRGQLPLPVHGQLLAKYGSRREDGPLWKGWFIRAAEGAAVKSVGDGRVVFADWLRGFGNLIIIDHGSQYLSIYGYNQAVLKHVGALVRTGDVIASAGNSGGNSQSGLYFEMRHQGRAFDPQAWMAHAATK